MRLLVDMNLSPSWVEQLSQRGFEALHWSTTGQASASDEDILAWARTNDYILLTHDLDFAAILAAGGDRAPSVVQLRVQDLLSDSAATAVAAALRQHSESLLSGALLSIDESGTRVRVLPIDR